MAWFKDGAKQPTLLLDRNGRPVSKKPVAAKPAATPWTLASLGGAPAAPARTKIGPAPKPVATIPDKALSESQVNQMANRASNVLAAGAQDRIRNLEQMLAGTGARGALTEASDEALAEAALKGQGARTEAELGAAQQNAQYALQRQQNEIAQRDQDLRYALESAGLESGERGQDIGREVDLLRTALEKYSTDTAAGTARRGQDVQARGQDVEALLAELAAGVQTRGQDVNRELGELDARTRARADTLDYNATTRGQDVSQQQALWNALMAGRGQDLEYATEGGRQRLAESGQQRDFELGRGRLDLDSQRARADALAQLLGLDVRQRESELDYLGRLYGIDTGSGENQKNRDLELILQVLRAA